MSSESSVDLTFFLSLSLSLSFSFFLFFWFAKKGCKKIFKKFASELRCKLGVMRGFQKGMTLDGQTSKSDNLVGLQKRVAKKFAKILHLSLDLSWGS